MSSALYFIYWLSQGECLYRLVVEWKSFFNLSMFKVHSCPTIMFSHHSPSLMRRTRLENNNEGWYSHVGAMFLLCQFFPWDKSNTSVIPFMLILWISLIPVIDFKKVHLNQAVYLLCIFSYRNGKMKRTNEECLKTLLYQF